MEQRKVPGNPGPCVLVLGMFDGVHLGHRQLLLAGRELADRTGSRLCVLTFEPHPMEVLCPDRAPGRLTTSQERAQKMEEMGVDVLCVQNFNRSVADMTPQAFLDHLLDTCDVAGVVCGYNYTFGKLGRGHARDLEAWGKEQGIPVLVMDEVRVDGEGVSSTRIRQLLEEGDVEKAARLLGGPYSLEGSVVHGKGIGHTLGFATANVKVPEGKALPAFGVYLAWADTDHRYPAMVNIGRHPTLPEGPVTVEAHLLTGDVDLYGRILRLEILKRMRGEVHFSGVDALIQQLREDRERALTWFQSQRT